MGLINWISNKLHKTEGVSSVKVSQPSQLSESSKPSMAGSIFDGQKSAQNSTVQTYTVQAGDSLWKVASKYGITTKELLNANPQINNSNLIYAGDKLKIPQSTKKEASQAPAKQQNVVNEAKKKALDAQVAFQNAPSRTKAEQQKELELQKDFIKAYTEWAKAIIADKSVPKEDIQEAIEKISGLKTYKAKEVQALQSELKNLLPELKKLAGMADTKVAADNKEVVNEKQQAILKRIEAVYDKDAAENLAKLSLKQASDSDGNVRTSSTGWCAKYANNAIDESGLVTKGSTRRESAYMLTGAFGSNDAFAKIQVSKDELKDLPAGCIVVWQAGKGSGKAFEEHGHVFITQGNGKATSDYQQDIKDYGTEFSVYVPKKKN